MIAKSRMRRGSGDTAELLCRQCARLVSCGTGASTLASAAQPPATPSLSSLHSACCSGALRRSALRQAAAIASHGD
jgi:hypothetical protein